MSEQPWLPLINQNTCTGCGDCVEICPTEALVQQEGKARLVKAEACTYCAECEAACPVGAIEIPYQIVLESKL